MYKIGRENKKGAAPWDEVRRGAGGKPEKLRTKEIKLMSFLEGELARDLAAPCRDGSRRGVECCVSPWRTDGRTVD